MFQFINPSTAFRGLRPPFAQKSGSITPAHKVQSPDQAGLQEYAVLEMTSTAKTPASLSNNHVVTVSVNAVTSFIALFHPESGFGFPAPFAGSSFEKGGHNAAAQKVIIIGAGTNVGKIAVQYAKLAHIGTIIGIASESREQELKDDGATDVIDRHLPQSEIVAKTIAIAGGWDSITRVYDCVNWTYELATELLAPNRASIFLALHPINEAAEANIKAKRPRCEPRFVVGTSKGLGAWEEGKWKHLPQWAENGLVLCPEVRILEGLDAGEVNKALGGYRDGNDGKQVNVKIH